MRETITDTDCTLAWVQSNRRYLKIALKNHLFQNRNNHATTYTCNRFGFWPPRAHDSPSPATPPPCLTYVRFTWPPNSLPSVTRHKTAKPCERDDNRTSSAMIIRDRTVRRGAHAPSFSLTDVTGRTWWLVAAAKARVGAAELSATMGLEAAVQRSGRRARGVEIWPEVVGDVIKDWTVVLVACCSEKVRWSLAKRNGRFRVSNEMLLLLNK